MFSATLPQKISNEAVKSARKEEIQKSKKMFEWISPPKEGEVGFGLPRYVKAQKYNELPLILKRDQVREENFLFKGLEAGINLVVTYLEGN